MIATIALRELRTLFLSPLAWTVLAVSQLILCWIFFSQIDTFFIVQPELNTLPNAPGVTDLVIAPVLEVASIMLLMISPLMTMRLIASGAWFGSMTPPAPTRMVSVPPAMCPITTEVAALAIPGMLWCSASQ